MSSYRFDTGASCETASDCVFFVSDFILITLVFVIVVTLSLVSIVTFYGPQLSFSYIRTMSVSL